jgi:hypothetical protein
MKTSIHLFSPLRYFSPPFATSDRRGAIQNLGLSFEAMPTFNYF